MYANTPDDVPGNGNVVEMKSTPLILNWHNDNAPIYSAHFQPNGKRLATAGGDNNVRLWKIQADGEDRSVEYLSTLTKHTQAVNVVRFAPKGEMLASAGDDGNVLLWIPQDHVSAPALGQDDLEDKESWRVRNILRSSGAEIYDLAWSPDAVFFIIGSMDNVARIYNAESGQMVRHIAEHNHYVQGVAWDPLNEYIATQSSDRSVHIYSLRTKDGQFSLDQQSAAHQTQHNRIALHVKMDLPGRRIASPAPTDQSARSYSSQMGDLVAGGASPAPSAPGTPNIFALPMNPPSVTMSHSRRSSFGSSPSMRRSASPAPSMPLPAIKPIDHSVSPRPFSHHTTTQAIKNSNLYANDSMTSFFRRLTFTPDGSLLFTPAGLYSNQYPNPSDPSKTLLEVINTVYVYTRGGINKPPIAHLPGSKKPSVVVKCSPVFYTIRKGRKTKYISIDTSSKESSDGLTSLPEPAVNSSSQRTDPQTTSTSTTSVMEPPPPMPLSFDPSGPTSSPRKASASSELENATPKPDNASDRRKDVGSETKAADRGPPSAFALPYRTVYAVATQDSVLLYDTQQQTPIVVVSNLHFAAFTDLSWSNDGLTLLMTSSDGFCSTLTFEAGELGEVYAGPLAGPSAAVASASSLSVNAGPFTSTTALGLGLERPSSSAQVTPTQTPTAVAGAGYSSPFPHQHHTASNSSSGAGSKHQRSSSSTSVIGNVSATSSGVGTGAGGFSTPVPTPLSSVAAASPTPPAQNQGTHIYEPSPIPSAYTNAGFVTTTPGANNFSSYGRPGSPTRSNSTSSVATQASTLTGLAGFGFNQRESASRDTIISNPPLVGGMVPSVGYGVGATPPQTPRSTASSVVGTGIKREVSEIMGASGGESEKESDAIGGGSRGVGARAEGREKKRRRVAPTLVSGGDANTSSK